MIRPAGFADVPGLRRLYAALVTDLDATRGPAVYPTPAAEDLDSFTLWAARRLEHDPACLVYVASDDATGELVGFLGGELSERALGEPRIFCAAHWLYVLPTARGQGIARALVARGCADLAALGVTHVELATRPDDPQWQARGWQPFLVHHALPLAAVLAGVADRPAVDSHNPTASAAPAPAPPPRRKRRRGRPPRPKLIAGGRA
jgi:GNAT superfamily N-acetyltransferase